MTRAEHIDQNTDGPRFSLNRTVSRRAAIGLGAVTAAGGLAALLLGRKNELAPATKQKANAPVIRGDNNTTTLSPAEAKNFFNEQLHSLSLRTLDGQPTTLADIVSGKPTLFVSFLVGSDQDWAKGALFPAIDKLRPELERAGAQAIALGVVYDNYIPSKVKFEVDNLEIAEKYPVVIEDKYNEIVTPTTGTLMLVDQNANHAGTFNIGQTQEILAAIANLPKGN